MRKIEELDRHLLGNRRELLKGKGHISHKQAIEKAKKEFEVYRTRILRELESDFDWAMKQLSQRNAGGDSDE